MKNTLRIDGMTPEQVADLVKTHISNHCKDLRVECMKQLDLQTTIKHARYYEGRISSYTGLIAYLDKFLVSSGGSK